MTEPIHVDITNVAHWLYVENSREHYDLDKDFVSLMSPWEQAVFDWHMPSRINSEGRIVETQPRGIVYKAVCVQERIADEYDRKARIGYFKRILRGTSRHPHSQENWSPLDELSKEECRHIGTYDVFITSPERGFMGRVMVHLDEEGHLMGMPHALVPDEHEAGLRLPSILYPVFFAFSFMACKNVELVDKPLNRQQRRKTERKGGVRYKVLTIHPLSTQKRYERQNQPGSGEKALHICRGHFATYTEDRPLFGKYVGTYWRPMHTRGSLSAGQVVKDYEVKL